MKFHIIMTYVRDAASITFLLFVILLVCYFCRSLGIKEGLSIQNNKLKNCQALIVKGSMYEI